MSVPEEYLCCLTGRVMREPVMAADRHTYEKEKIEEWLQTHDERPRTKELLQHKTLIDNLDRQKEVSAFLECHPALYDKRIVYLPDAWIRQCVIAIKKNQQHDLQKWLAADSRLLTLKLEGDSTALHLACEFGSPELVDLLLKILKQSNKLELLGASGFKVARLNVLLEKTLNSRDYGQCEFLLKLGAEVEQLEVSTGNTLLHRMVINGNDRALSWLLEQKVALESRNLQREAIVLVDIQNTEGNTPLHLAVQGEHHHIIATLLEVGACHKIRNDRDQTPIELARSQKNIKMANAIMQKVREHKKTILKEVDKLHSVILEQAKEIALLKATCAQQTVELKNALENQSQWQEIKTQFFDMQAQIKGLQVAVSKTFLSTSNLDASIIPQLPSRHSPLVENDPADALERDAIEIEKFLMLVATGEQNKAEALLKKNAVLALASGNVTDLSERTFTGITGFQYAVWALDWHM